MGSCWSNGNISQPDVHAASYWLQKNFCCQKTKVSKVPRRTSCMMTCPAILMEHLTSVRQIAGQQTMGHNTALCIHTAYVHTVKIIRDSHELSIYLKTHRWIQVHTTSLKPRYTGTITEKYFTTCACHNFTKR